MAEGPSFRGSLGVFLKIDLASLFVQWCNSCYTTYLGKRHAEGL